MKANHLHKAYGQTIDHLRKERDTLQDRCSDLDLQIDNLEVQLSKLKLENVTLKDTVAALKECESVKVQESKSIEWNGEGLPPVGAMFTTNPEFDIELKCVYSSEMCVIGLMPESLHSLDVVITDFLTSDTREFRPIESPEQKAQREREEVILDLFEASGEDRSSVLNNDMTYDERGIYEACQNIFDAGYRKQ